RHRHSVTQLILDEVVGPDGRAAQRALGCARHPTLVQTTVIPFSDEKKIKVTTVPPWPVNILLARAINQQPGIPGKSAEHGAAQLHSCRAQEYWIGHRPALRLSRRPADVSVECRSVPHAGLAGA